MSEYLSKLIEQGERGSNHFSHQVKLDAKLMLARHCRNESEGFALVHRYLLVTHTVARKRKSTEF